MYDRCWGWGGVENVPLEARGLQIGKHSSSPVATYGDILRVSAEVVIVLAIISRAAVKGVPSSLIALKMYGMVSSVLIKGNQGMIGFLPLIITITD